MIGTALDQVQKLFGRGFWLAAFVPSLLFVGIASYLLMDLDGLRSTVLALTQKDLKEAGLNIVLSVVAVYLMAYVVYGARSAIHDLYRGEWPITLRWLERLCLRQQRRARNRALAELQAREVLLDNVRWATTFGFTITFSEENIATSEAIADLLKVRQQHADLVAYAR